MKRVTVLWLLLMVGPALGTPLDSALSDVGLQLPRMRAAIDYDAACIERAFTGWTLPGALGRVRADLELQRSRLARLETRLQAAGGQPGDLSPRQGARVTAAEIDVRTQLERIDTLLTRLVEVREELLSRLWEQDSPPLWALPRDGEVARAVLDKMSGETTEAWSYVQDRRDAYLVLLLAALGLLLGLLGAKDKLTATSLHETRVAEAVRSRPFATSLLLASLMAFATFPQAPPAILATLGALALLSAVFIVRTLLPAKNALQGLLHATILLFVVRPLLDVFEDVPLASRLLLLVELCGTAGVLYLMQRKPSPCRWAVPLAIALLLSAAVASLVGCVRLAAVVANTVFGSGLFMGITWIGVEILEWTLLLALRRLEGVRSVQQNFAAVKRWTHRTLRLGWQLAWVCFTLDSLDMLSALWDGVRAGLAAPITVGALTFQVGNVLACVVSLWLSYQLSRVLPLVLDADVFPRLELHAGVPHAISTLARYAVGVGGTAISFVVLGIDRTHFALLAGAFGVGLGLGFQTLANNVICGIILLLERPVRPGDDIEVAGHRGVVQHIGIRSSIVKTWDDAEVMVPNGTMLANTLSNWTYSSTLRGIEASLQVELSVPASSVMAAMEDAVKGSPGILADPPPPGPPRWQRGRGVDLPCARVD